MKRIFPILMALLLLAACKPDPVVAPGKAAAPEFVSSDPVSGTTGLAGDKLTMKLTYDQNIKCPSDQQKNVRLEGGGTIDKVNAYNTVLTVEISGLDQNSGKEYTVVVPEGAVLGFRENQEPAAEVRIRFTMKYVEPYVPSTLDPVKTLVNPNASQQAKNVYGFLLEQSGKKTLSGVQSSHSNTNDYVDAVYKATGKHPALAGYDFIFLQYSPTPEGWSWVRDYNDISAPKAQWAANGLVNYMWHWNVPDSEAAWKNATDNYNFDGYNFYSDKTSFDIKEALKEGTWQNRFIMNDIAEVAGYLKLLQAENIPVIWRPLHEAAGNYDLYGPNGAWFWWGRGGAEPCKQLWRLLYDQLVNVHGLNNLIWVWTVDVAKGAEDQYLDWYPGDEYVDIVGVDIYAADTEAKTRQYQALVDLTKGKKLVTVSECGNIPDPTKCMEAGNRWSWFMVWPTSDENGNILLNTSDQNFKLNTLDYWKKVMGNKYVITREAMPSLK